STRAVATPLYTLSLHDALPIFGKAARCCRCQGNQGGSCTDQAAGGACSGRAGSAEEEAQLQAAARTRSAARKNRRSREKHRGVRSEEHTSELQSRENLVCRLLL